MPFFNIFFAETSLDWKPSTFLQREWKNWHRQRTLLSWLFLLLLSLMQLDLPRVRVDTAERGLFKGCLWLCRDMSAWKFIANNDKRMVNLYCLFLFCSRRWQWRGELLSKANWDSLCWSRGRNNQNFVEPKALRNQKKSQNRTSGNTGEVFKHLLLIVWSSQVVFLLKRRVK